MVPTLEPGIQLGPVRMLVDDEGIVIREVGAEWLSGPAGRLEELHARHPRRSPTT